ncbi:MAG: glyoxylase-like metal-dependent hydrolase (beta-lactamase superfamily II) [Bacteriovoracaceae bacterium]|jgi:glyoxylase-like metal-dependent hydrolase (beta-lactamase superfamily II)
MEVSNYILESGQFMLDGGAMFGIIPKPLWSRVHAADESNRIDLSLRLWCIKTDERLIVTDTGIGDYHHDNFNTMFNVRVSTSPLEKSLEAVGFKADDVTDLIISHLHFDHVGGLGKKDGDAFSPVFQNATLHLHKDHYNYALNPTERDAGSFHVKNFSTLIDFYDSKKKLTWHEGEEGVLLSLGKTDLRFKCSFGHTPYLMHPYSDKYIYLADLIPTSNHVHVPWVMGYDIEPGVTTKYKREFLDFVIKRDLKIIFEHDPKFWGSKIEKNEKGKYICKEADTVVEKPAYLIS